MEEVFVVGQIGFPALSQPGPFSGGAGGGPGGPQGRFGLLGEVAVKEDVGDEIFVAADEVFVVGGRVSEVGSKFFGELAGALCEEYDVRAFVEMGSAIAAPGKFFFRLEIVAQSVSFVFDSLGEEWVAEG